MARVQATQRTATSAINHNAEAQDRPWRNVFGVHDFGGTPVTINEALDAIGGNYEVTKEHLLRLSDAEMSAIKEGNLNLEVNPRHIIDSHRATVNTDNDNMLGVVGKDYGIAQNKQAFEFIDVLTSGTLGEEQKPIIETAAVLGGGQRIFITAKMPNQFKIEGDPRGIDDYLIFRNTFDGSGAVQIYFTPIRVICQNMLAASVKQGHNRMSLRHTSGISSRIAINEENIKKAVETMKLHEIFKKEFIDKLNALARVKVDDSFTREFVAKLLATPSELKLAKEVGYDFNNVEEISSRKTNKYNTLMEAIEGGIGQQYNRGTRLWLYNGVTTYLQNAVAYRDGELKMDSIIDGTGAQLSQKAVNLLAA